MDLRIALSTFILIFLAELGDKTQLAAFAAGASSRSFWPVFLGASAALVVSTLVAVLLGNALQQVLPLHYVRLAAGVLFVLAGVLLIASAWGETREPALSPAGAETSRSAGGDAAGKTASPGAVTRLALHAAARFEEAVLARYEELARRSREPRAAKVFAALAAEERRHLASIHRLACGLPQRLVEEAPPAPRPPLTPAEEAGTRELARELAAHEKQAGAFFRELARRMPLPGARRALLELAADEDRHARALRGLSA